MTPQPDVLDTGRGEDPAEVLERVLGVLSRGGQAALASAGGAVVAARADDPAAVARLGAGGERPALALAGPGDLAIWVRPEGRVERRLARRGWPGPLVLEFAGAGPDRVPASVRALAADGTLALACPESGLARAAVQAAGFPVAVTFVADAGAGRADLVATDGVGPAGQRPTVVRVEPGGWRVVRPGAVAAETLAGWAACRVVFVCTGNTCRSPLAEALCRRKLADRLGCRPEELPGRGFLVQSAGLVAMMGDGPAREAVLAARTFGGELAGHVSRPLTGAMARDADHLVAMTWGHLQAVVASFPDLAARPRLLAAGGRDLPDPVGGDQAVYDWCAEQIWRDLDSVAAEVLSGEPAAGGLSGERHGP